jgi:hypothetical protein
MKWRSSRLQQFGAMPLLRSLAGTKGAPFYTHGAPDGAWLESAALQRLSLTPRLQPGEKAAQTPINRFNGFSSLARRHLIESTILMSEEARSPLKFCS